MKKLIILAVGIFFFIFFTVSLSNRCFSEENTSNESAAVSNEPADTAAKAETPADNQAAKPEKPQEPQLDVTTIATATGQGPFIPSEAIQTDTFTGTANMGIPIAVVSGRKGIQPNLAISYNSSAGNGWCGVGWSLDLGSIQRSTKYGPPQYNDSDTFIFAQAGSVQELVNISPGEYRAKTEGAFMKFTYENGYWIVKDKKGITYYFGVTAPARQLNPNNNLTFKWCLEAVKDLSGNYMNISYVTYDYQIYPQTIRYTGLTAETLPPFPNEGLFAEVNFVLEDRTDIISNYSTGGGGTGGAQPIKTTKRLKTIEIKAENNLVRKYVLDYQQSQRTNRSLISQVTLYADNGTTILPPTTFTYQEINDTTYTIMTNNITNQGDNLWNIRFDNGDYFHNNEWILYPWGQFSNGQWIYGWIGPFLQASYSDPQHSWTITPDGSFNYWGCQDTAFHAWTYVYVPNATTITIPWTADVGFMWLNGDYTTNGLTHTFNLNAGYNLLEITGYNQNDNSPFNLNYPLASNVSVMHSYWFAKPQLTGDFNGDGLTDFATFDDYGGIWRVVLSFGSGFFPDQIWLSGMGNSDTTPVVGDFNNDGKSDVCSFDKTSGDWQFAYSNGQNAFSIGPAYNANWINYKPLVGDYNGDGFLDLCGFEPTTGNWYVALANGQGDFNNPQLWVSGFGPEQTPLGGDFNGDGLTDALYFDKTSGSWYVAFSNGTDAFIPSTSNPWATNFGTDKEPIIVDFNGDGLTDIGYLNRENSALTIMLSNGYSAFANQQDWITNFTITSNNMVAQLGDYNGDGLIDPAIFDPFTNAAQVAITTGKVSDLLSSFNNGVGGSSTINYLPSTSMPNYGGDMSNDLPFVAQVVSSVTTSDGLGNQYTTSYYYKDGLYDIQDREFRGFGYAKVTDALGTTNETYFYQDDILKGCSYHEGEIKDNTGNLYQQILNEWDYVQPYAGYNIYFRRLRSKTTYFYNGDTQSYAQFAKQTRSEYDYDAYGNITHLADLGDWDMGIDDKHIYTSYLYNTENNLVSLPNYTYLTDWQNNIAKYSWCYYDNHTSIEELPTVGNLTKQEDWFQTPTNLTPVPGSPDNPITSFTYDTFGNLLTTTDAIGNITPEPDDRTTTIAYDPDYHLFPLTTTNALNHIITNAYYGINGVPLDDGTYRGLWGQVKSSTDTNNVTTVTIYDSFGRVSKTVGPNDTPDLPTAFIEYNLSPTIPINIVTHSRIEHGEVDTLDSITFYDGLGRAIEAKSFSEIENQYIVSGQVEFNSRGLPEKKYLPFFSTNPMNTMDPINPTNPHTAIEYDVLGRVIELTNPDSTYATTSYHDWTITTIDPNGHMTKSYKDAFGRLAKVEEYLGADGRDVNYPLSDYTLYATTNYSYDASNNLTTLVDTIGSTTTITYDSLNRKTSMNDPDMGYWTYQYDLVGNLISQTDAKNQTITFDYDAINRLTQKLYNSINPTSPVNYTYDDITIPYSKGRLTKASYANAAEDTKFYYDNLGREIQSSKKIDNNEYNIYRTYDALGRLKSLIYPDGEVLTYTYNLQGQIEQVMGIGAPDCNTKLLLHCDGEDGSTQFMDSSSLFHSVSAQGNAQIDTAQSQFGEASGLFDGSGDYLSIPDSDDWNFGSGDFTVDFWARFSDVSTYRPIIGQWDTGGQTAWVIAYGQYGYLDFYFSDGALTQRFAFSPNIDTWYHIAVVRSGNNLMAFVDGNQIGTTIDVSGKSVVDRNAPLWIGKEYGGASPVYYSGWLDEIRISKGIARWTANFTPPQEPYTPEPVLYVSNVDYNASNQMTNVVYGNGTQTTYTYNPTTLRLTNLLTQNNQNVTLQNLTYTFDSVGNVISIVDAVNTNTQYFTYDHLNRLTSANAPNSYGLKEYQYNTVGNILSKEGVGFTYDNLRPHAVTGTSAGPTTFNYDNNGNMTSVVAPTYYVPNSTYEYDEENRLIRAENYDARSRTHFYYDGDGGRTKKYTVKRQDIQVSSGATPLLQQKVWEFLVAVNPFSTKEAQAASLDHIITIATTNIYIGQTYEIVKETHQLPVAKKYIYLGPNRICSVENGEAYYYHTDHLNSSNIITDDTGTQQKRLEYMPYGGTSVESGTYSTNYRFTGKELDDETGLYFYGARYYNPIIGRFITPDSIVQAPQNPQTLNRYSYCVNNPVNYTDPSGHFLFLPALIGALIGGLIGGINAAINGGNFFEGFFGGALVGLGAGFGAFSFASVAWGMGTGAGISAYYGGDPLLGAISGGVGAILGGAIPIHSPNLLAHLAGNALKGAIIGATTSAIMGGDIGLGALAGAGVGAVMGFITSEQFQNAIQGNGFRSSRVDIAEQYEQEINKIHSLNPSASEDIELKIGLRQVAGIAQHEFIQLPDGTIIEMGPNNAGQIQIFKYNVNNEASIQGALSLGNTPIDTLGALRSSTVTWVQTSMSASVLTNSLNSYVGHWGGSIYYPTSYNSNYFVNTVVYGQSGNITGNFGWAPTFAHKY